MGWGDSKITHSLQEFRGLNELCKYQDTAEHISKSEHHVRAGWYSDSFSFSRGVALCCMLEVRTWKSHSCPQGACRQVKEPGSWSSSYSPMWLVSRTRMMNNQGGNAEAGVEAILYQRVIWWEEGVEVSQKLSWISNQSSQSWACHLHVNFQNAVSLAPSLEIQSP